MGAPSSGPTVELCVSSDGARRQQAVSKAAGGNSRPVRRRTLEKLPPVNHVVALFQPREAGHSPARGGAIQVNDHVILRHHQLQGTYDVSAKRRWGKQRVSLGARSHTRCKLYKHDQLFIL